MSSKAVFKKFSQTNIKFLTVQFNRLNLDINTKKIDNHKEIKTKRLLNQIRIKLPNLSQKKLIEIIKNKKTEKNLDDYFIGNYTKNKNLNTTINSCRAKPKPKTKSLNRQSLKYYYRINSYKKYKTIDQEIKNKQNLFPVRNNTLENEKHYKIPTNKNNIIREGKKLNTNSISFDKKITKLLGEKSLTKNSIFNNYHKNNRVCTNKKVNNSTFSLISSNSQFKESKYYKTIQATHNEIFDDYQSKFPNIRKINVSYLLKFDNNKNEKHDIKKRHIKSYREFKINQEIKRRIKKQEIIDAENKKLFSTDNENNKTNFNKFCRYNKNKKSIKYLKAIIENIDDNMRKKIEKFVKNLDNEFKNFTDHAYIPLNEVLKIKNK